MFHEDNEQIYPSAAEEGQNWKMHLYHFLCQYRVTSHSTTKVSPFEVYTKRKRNIGILFIPYPKILVPIHFHISVCDDFCKDTMKTKAGQRYHIQTLSLLSGDDMLVKQPRHNKLSLPFNPKSYIVIQRKGSMVTERDSH